MPVAREVPDTRTFSLSNLPEEPESKTKKNRLIRPVWGSLQQQGLYVVAQQAICTAFSQATFLQAICTAFGQATFLQAICTAFSQATFLQAICTAFSQATFLQAICTAFGNACFNHAIGAAFSDYRVGESVCSQYRKSEAKQELAFHGGVLQVF
ncbi:hypothetical protein [Pseudomonas sp. 37 R 15]|nr:hypothetical protein [Pseudomonas sp. 37 R 15]